MKTRESAQKFKLRHSTAERVALKTGEVLDLDHAHVTHFISGKVLVGFEIDDEGYATTRQLTIPYAAIERHVALGYPQDSSVLEEDSERWPWSFNAN